MRKLIPASPPNRASGSGSGSLPSSSTLALLPLDARTKSPCEACKKKKVRCNGNRPTCARCASTQTTCVYEGADGLNWVDRIRAELRASNTQLATLQQVIHGLRSGSDNEASFILARLRTGESVNAVVRSMASSVTPPAAVNIPEERTKPPPEPADMMGDFLFPVFDRNELSVPPDALLAEVLDWKDGRIVLLEPFNQINQESEVRRTTTLWPPQSSSHEELLTPTSRFRPSQTPRPEIQVHPSILRSGHEISSGATPSGSGHVGGCASGHLPRLFVPRWCMMVLNTDFDGTADGALSGFLRQAKEQLSQGVHRIQLVGEHAYVGALFDEAEFQRAPALSKWAVRVVHSIRGANYSTAVFGTMYFFWWVMRWMLDPSEEHFDEMPEWLRPVPNQLFMPHPMILDFFLWPALREYVVQHPSLHVGMNWLLDAAGTMNCGWSSPPEEALCKNAGTGGTDLSRDAKGYISNLQNWSLGPSFRKYIPNADALVSIRAEP